MLIPFPTPAQRQQQQTQQERIEQYHRTQELWRRLQQP